MYYLSLNGFSLSVDFESGHVDSLILNGKERIFAKAPLFSVGFRKENGDAVTVSSYDAASCKLIENGAVYGDFPIKGISVSVFLDAVFGEAEWRIRIENSSSDTLCEWVDFPSATLPPLLENNADGNGGEILFPYNEGALVSDLAFRESSSFPHRNAVYPSLGAYAVFPNMICSQMLAYLWEDCGLYVGVHDPERAVKVIDFYGRDGGVTMQTKVFCGTDPGQGFYTEYPIVWAATAGKWESAAERYRKWFETDLPVKVKKIKDNVSLPEWYEDSPVIVSYPVRGTWDMDEMSPNAFYPYTNALPLINSVKEKTNSRVLALLMHWEGTAPWAPPYVWPPYGSLDNFNEFRDKLHESGDLLGVYCSGFGYTKQSNLIARYNKKDEYESQELWRGMCADYDGKVKKSLICTSQRSGYDICPDSPVGREVLDRAYSPLFEESGLDYVQILDQNHGGGQYFCHSKEHGHPQAPGAWMTKSMQKMLADWNDAAPNMLFGCESAAAEPFIGNLLFSDNRYELCYRIGRAVPLYSYIYHEYIRNFMGNQVSCPFAPNSESLRYRIAYSFAAGDCITLVFSPDGELMPNWGRPRHTVAPDKEKALTLVGNLMKFYKEQAKPYLFDGRMIPCPEIKCESVSFEHRDSDHISVLPSILASAWQVGHDRAIILVNPDDRSLSCEVSGKKYTVPPLNAMIIDL